MKPSQVFKNVIYEIVISFVAIIAALFAVTTLITWADGSENTKLCLHLHQELASMEKVYPRSREWWDRYHRLQSKFNALCMTPSPDNCDSYKQKEKKK